MIAPSRCIVYRPRSQYILTAKIETLDPGKPSMVVIVDEDLKGKVTFRKLPVNLTGDADAKKLDHLPQLLKRLAPKLPLVLFMSQMGDDLVTFAYTNGTWFQMIGTKDDDTIRWRFTHGEPFLRAPSRAARRNCGKS